MRSEEDNALRIRQIDRIGLESERELLPRSWRGDPMLALSEVDRGPPLFFLAQIRDWQRGKSGYSRYSDRVSEPYDTISLRHPTVRLSPGPCPEPPVLRPKGDLTEWPFQKHLSFSEGRQSDCLCRNPISLRKHQQVPPTRARRTDPWQLPSRKA